MHALAKMAEMAIKRQIVNNIKGPLLKVAILAKMAFLRKRQSSVDLSSSKIYKCKSCLNSLILSDPDHWKIYEGLQNLLYCPG